MGERQKPKFKVGTARVHLATDCSTFCVIDECVKHTHNLLRYLYVLELKMEKPGVIHGNSDLALCSQSVRGIDKPLRFLRFNAFYSVTRDLWCDLLLVSCQALQFDRGGHQLLSFPAWNQESLAHLSKQIPKIKHVIIFYCYKCQWVSVSASECRWQRILSKTSSPTVPTPWHLPRKCVANSVVSPTTWACLVTDLTNIIWVAV